MLLVGCRDGVPQDVLSEEEMKEVLYDYHLALAMAENSSYDSVTYYRQVYADAALRKHGITQAELDSSLVWYTRHTDYLQKVYQSLSEQFAAEASQKSALTGEAQMYANLTQNGDTANVWMGRQFYILTPSEFTNRMTFHIKSDSLFLVHDRFRWKFMPQFIYREGARMAVAVLTIHYDNDSTASTSYTFRGSFETQVELQGDKTHGIKSISGYIYHKAPVNQGYKMLTVEDITLIRFHDPVPPPVLETPTDSAAVLE